MPRKPANKSTKKAAARRPAATPVNASARPDKWLYLLATIAVLGFAGFIVYLDKSADNQSEKQINKLQHPANQAKPKNKENKITKKEKKKAPAKTKEEEEIHYDFYEILPEVEIEPNIARLPDKQNSIHQNKTKSTPDTPKKANTTEQSIPASGNNNNDLYQLQISAFRTKEKAESLKAQLAFMGVQSNISSRLTSKGQKLYRVRIGPTSDKENLIKIKRSLEKRNFKPFMQKI